MQEEIMLRDNFDEIDVFEVGYILYDLVDGMPDFSTYTIGSEQSIVLRNIETGKLERINFRVEGDNGEFFTHSRRLWGEIHARDSETKHCYLCFYFNFNQDGLKDLAASFCAKMP